MRRVVHAEEFRRHYRRVVVGSLLRHAEAETVAPARGRLGRHRARRAEREAVGLRLVLDSFDRSWQPAAAALDHSDAGRAALRLLAGGWTFCAVSAAAAAAWRGLVSDYAAAADLALLAVSTALFVTYLLTGETSTGRDGGAATPDRGDPSGIERRSGLDRRLSDTGAWFGLERRSGSDRRAGAALNG